eukprot:TRINITY_DN1891_c0_g1_i1.p1 TRINITY_DN1891_c0_g1~~TRINITY_DN1891_c0_g1_i1.p1  ORF type:complete len:299 (-),score=63.86 TRINITY_DN1891_c0_g1_i1:972-1868(-)
MSDTDTTHTARYQQVIVESSDTEPIIDLTLSRQESARSAYDTMDADLSRAVHQAHGTTKHREPHNSVGAYIRSAVYGGLDGIICIFGVVSGVTGGQLPWTVLIVIGIANLLSDALSMGLGDYISTNAEVLYAASERKRERWECDNYLEGEIEEMIEFYEKKGLSNPDATRVVELLSKDKDIFVDFMMIEELGILPEEESRDAWKHGLVTFAAFVLFGSVPLASFVVAYATMHVDESTAWQCFLVACGFTLLTLFILGAIKARFTNERWYWSGMQTTLLGGAAAGIAYGISYGISTVYT